MTETTRSIAFLVLLVNSAYIAAFATPASSTWPTCCCISALGLGLMVRRRLLACGAIRWRASPSSSRGLPAIFLAVRGNTMDHRWVALDAHRPRRLSPSSSSASRLFHRRGAARLANGLRDRRSSCSSCCPPAARSTGEPCPIRTIAFRIPPSAPVSMDEEGGGAQSPFSPSSAQTNTGGIIPSNFFMDSEALRRVPQGYLRAVEGLDAPLRLVQQPVLPEVHRVHAGRDRHAAAASGAPAATITRSSSTAASTSPIKEQIDTPEAQAGLGCMSCHAIVHVDSSMGNGDFTDRVSAAARAGHQQESSTSARIDYFLTYLNPEPHRRTFMKPFMRRTIGGVSARPATRCIWMCR